MNATIAPEDMVQMQKRHCTRLAGLRYALKPTFRVTAHPVLLEACCSWCPVRHYCSSPHTLL